jgi:hypothetical protein
VLNRCSVSFSVLLAHDHGRLAHVNWVEPDARISVLPQGELTDLRIALTATTTENWRLSTPVLVSANVESQQTIRIAQGGGRSASFLQTTLSVRGGASTLEVWPVSLYYRLYVQSILSSQNSHLEVCVVILGFHSGEQPSL